MADRAVSEAILAIDLGTSAIKLLVVDRTGAVVARERLPHATHRLSPTAAEQDPGEWWGNLTRAIPELAPNHRLAAIGVTGQMHGLVLHGDGLPLGNAITWEDRRSATALPDLLRQLPPDRPAIAPGYQAASWHWLLQEHLEHLELAAQARRILLPKDEIIHRLTRRYLTDPSDAVGTGWYDTATGTWDRAVIEAAGAHAVMLPEIVPAGSVAGPLCAETAAALGLETGIPVVIAGGDAAVGAFGAGATQPETPLFMLSTGCQVLQPTMTRPESDAWPSANPAGLPGWLRVATTLNGGNVVRWARETLAEPSLSTATDLVFLPYLHGERSEALDPDAAGAFVGLRSHHSRANMARAAIDGVALALVDAFERIGGEIGFETPVFVGGGGVHDAVWLEALANALGRPLEVIAEGDLSAWGAARSAATALGWIDTVNGPLSWRPASRRISPPTDVAVHAGERLRHFRDAAYRLYGRDRRGES
jgi:xylulokinase